MNINKMDTGFELPFKIKVSFKKVFDYWHDQAKNGNNAESQKAKTLLKRLEPAKVLWEPFENLDHLATYEKEIEMLLSALFPEALQLNEIKTATLPFQQVFFNMTKRFENIIEKGGNEFSFSFDSYDEDFMYVVTSSIILNQFYGTNLNLSRPTIFSVPDKRTGITRTYRGFFNADFSEFKKTDKSPELSEEQVHNLISNVNNIELWKKTIPPCSFELHGFGLLTIFDVTTDQALSKLKVNLIKKDALVTPVILSEMEENMQRLFNIGDLEMGLAIVHGHELKSVKQNSWNSILLSKEHRIAKKAAFCAHSKEHLFGKKQFLAVSDIDKLDPNLSPLFKVLKNTGMKSYIIAPLVYDEKVIGFLELGSKTPGVLNQLASSYLDEIVPLFSIALQRSWDEFENQIEALIKEKATAIHPSVEWRFFNAAYNLFQARANGDEVEMEEIRFERVFPLYGQMDIKGSSTFREKGIQKDLITQLKLAKGVFEKAKMKENLIVYDQLVFQINEHMRQVRKKISTADEAIILDFFKKTLQPVLDHVMSIPEMEHAVKEYTQRIDPKIGMVYEGRKIYEETVTQINEHISAYIDKSQIEAQALFPHYFEKYKTDGVEYNMYIGQSMVEEREYSDLYLRNLRLWQLIMTCEVENLIQTLKPTFEVPLEIASLILVQNRPLDIKFRQDEKKFDVDGAYNARYEIVKKRIDKALIQGKEERLTQPGKIAIVYSNDVEKAEYLTYLNFLVNKKYINPKIEELSLGDLQGASGLRALRVGINYNSIVPAETFKDEEVHAFLQEIQ